MGKIILVTGGARSGKSEYAEQILKEEAQNVIYIATAKPLDDEMTRRIFIHKKRRPSYWRTIELYDDVTPYLKEHLLLDAKVLIDCVTIMISNLIYQKNRNLVDSNNDEMLEVASYIYEKVDILIEFMKNVPNTFVLVTNEIGMSIVPDSKFTRFFRDVAGYVNQKFTKNAHEVIFCVSGVPIKIK